LPIVLGGASVLQIVIPAFNEESRLGQTLLSLRHYVSCQGAALRGNRVEVIVVDNGSSDDTSGVAVAHDSPELPVRVIRHEDRGKGAATRAGIAATTGEYVAFMDADGATDLTAFEEGIRLVRAGTDVAIGSRIIAGADTSARHQAWRGHGAVLHRALTRRILPGIADTQCGFKVMRGDVARTLFQEVTIRGFSFDVELLVLARRRMLRITEFPVRWVDQPGSTFRPASHGLWSFLDLARVRWRLGTVPAGILAPSPRPRTLPGGPAVMMPRQRVLTETPVLGGLALDG